LLERRRAKKEGLEVHDDAELVATKSDDLLRDVDGQPETASTQTMAAVDSSEEVKS
jgi:hypothetical protein